MSALRLHDVDDAQRFVCAVVNKSGLTLSWSDREDPEQFLLETAYLLSLRYEPRAGSFSNYAYVRLRQRTIDCSESVSVGEHGSSAAGVPTSGNSPSSSVSTPREIPLERLSERSVATLRQFGTRLAEGYSPREIAREFGTSTRCVSTRLEELRAELERLDD